jgi:hypothetical protein
LVVSTVAILLLAGGIRPLLADSTPYMNVATYGVELCSQDICGAAIFAGALSGQVGNNPRALGAFVVAVNHDPLPAPFQSAAITGGSFDFKVGRRHISGVVTGGTLFNNGNNTFTVHADLEITSGGNGTLAYDGLLNHNVFPPTVIGTVVTQ